MRGHTPIVTSPVASNSDVVTVPSHSRVVSVSSASSVSSSRCASRPCASAVATFVLSNANSDVRYNLGEQPPDVSYVVEVLRPTNQIAVDPAAVALLMSIPVPVPLTDSDPILFPAIECGLVASHRRTSATSPGSGSVDPCLGTEGGDLG